MAAAMEMPATMEILCNNDLWVCDTAASKHFARARMVYITAARLAESQGMTGGHVEVLYLRTSW